jgi:hypothetical protein
MLRVNVAKCKCIDSSSKESELNNRFSGAMSLTDTREYLGGIGRTKLYEIIRRGRLQVTYIDSKPVVLVEDADRFLADARSKSHD